jgi:superfamily II DNA or RNA helicase
VDWKFRLAENDKHVNQKFWSSLKGHMLVYYSKFPAKSEVYSKVMDSAPSIEEGVAKALTSFNIRREARKIVLKPVQETAVKQLLNGDDLVAILPTGFGKSLIFTIFALAREEMFSSRS